MSCDTPARPTLCARRVERFQMAAVSWKNLTQEQRQGYIHLFHANEVDPALDILPEPLPGVNNESRAERVGHSSSRL